MVGGEADSQQHLADRNSDASSSCMCKSTPPSAPLAPPIGPGIVPTALFRQECLLAPQRETEKERETSEVLLYSVVCCSFSRMISPCRWCYKGSEHPTQTPEESHRRTRSTLICHGNTLSHVNFALISATRLFWRCPRLSRQCASSVMYGK